MTEGAPRYWIIGFNDRTWTDDGIVTIELGFLVIAAISLPEALQEAQIRGLHPGGAAYYHRALKRGVFADPDIARRHTYRLLEGLDVHAALEVIQHEEATLPDDPEPPLLHAW